MDLTSQRVDVAAGATTAAPPELRYGPAFDAWSGERSEGIRSGSGTVNPKSALSLAAYYAAINVLSTDLSSLPIKIFRKRKSGGRDEVTDDPRSDLLAVSPDDETTSMRMRQALLGHTFGWGNGYAEIAFTGGEVTGLYLLDPTVEPSRRTQDKRLYYRMPDGGTRPPYKILHLAGFGYDGLCGYSPARLMAQTINLGRNAERFGAAFFNNGIRASGYFEHPHKYTKDAADDFRRSIDQMHRGPDNAHTFMMLWGGTKWTQSTIPPEEAQFLETRQFQVLEIARMFRLPPHKLGDYSQSHLSNIEESNIDYMTTVLMPWCESFEQELNRKLFTREERLRGFYVEHQMEAFLRGNSASRGAWYQTMFGLGQYTINEIRAKENLNPVPGDVGDERFLTVQAQPLSTLLNPAPAPAAEPTGGPASGKPPRVPVPSVNGKRFEKARKNGHAKVGAGASRFNPNHGADGQFSSGPGRFGGIAPATTATGSKIVVEESGPKSAADRKQLAAAEAAGKTAIHVKDTPDVEVKRSESGTITKVGDYTASTITKAPDGSGWKFRPHDYDGQPQGEGDTKIFRSREKAEKLAQKDAKDHQEWHSRESRINTKDPERVLKDGHSAHEYDFGEYKLDPAGKLKFQVGTKFDKTNSNWTTTYRVLKKPEGERSRRIDIRFNPNHGADGKFSSGKSSLSGHAPATTHTGATLEVTEGPPQTPGDKKFAADAAANGKTPFRVTDTPHLEVNRTEEATDYHVGGTPAKRVERGEGEWKIVSYDNDGNPLGGHFADSRDTRAQAEKVAARDARSIQKQETVSVRVATRDPEGLIAKGKTAHEQYYDPRLGGTGPDRTNAKWTTTYYHMKTPEG